MACRCRSLQRKRLLVPAPELSSVSYTRIWRYITELLSALAGVWGEAVGWRGQPVGQQVLGWRGASAPGFRRDCPDNEM